MREHYDEMKRTEHTLDFTTHCFLIQAFGVSLCTFLNTRIDKHLDKWKLWVVFLVQLACDVAVGFVRRNERSNGDRCGRSEE